MPRRCRHCSLPKVTLPWFGVKQRLATLDPNNREALAGHQRLLDFFHWDINNHHIPCWGSSKKVSFLSEVTRQFYVNTLRELLVLEYEPRAVRIPMSPAELASGPHRCRFCGPYRGIEHPFELVAEIKRGRGRPRQLDMASMDDYFVDDEEDFAT